MLLESQASLFRRAAVTSSARRDQAIMSFIP
jgi:hypothetical protein